MKNTFHCLLVLSLMVFLFAVIFIPDVSFAKKITRGISSQPEKINCLAFPLTDDAGIIASIIDPDSSCGRFDGEIYVVIYNYGTNDLTSIPVKIEVSGAAIQAFSLTYNGLISAGSFDTLLVTNTFNTAAGGNFYFNMFTELAGDADPANDTLNQSRYYVPMTSAPVIVGDSICGPGYATFYRDTSSASELITWYDSTAAGNLLATGDTFVTHFLTATTSFYVQAGSQCPSNRITVKAIVHPQAQVHLGNDTIITAGDTITLDAGTGYNYYEWNSGENSQTLDVSLQGWYSIIVLDSNYCSATDSIFVNVASINNIGIINIISPVDQQCEDSMTQLTVAIKNFGSNSQTDIPVEVYISGIANFTLTDTLHSLLATGDTAFLTLPGSINTLGGGSLNLKAYTSLSSDTDPHNDTLQTTLSILIVPLNPVTSQPALICDSGSVTLTATSNSPIFWYDSITGGNLIGAGISFVTPVLFADSVFYAQAGNTCPSVSRTPDSVHVYQSPVVFLGNDTIINSGSLILNAGIFQSYLWSTSDTTQTITVNATGDYFVTVTASNGCTATDTIHVDILTGVNFKDNVIGFSISPNPFNNSFTVELKKEIHFSSLVITDVAGREISFHADKISSRKWMIEMKDVSTGVYFLRLNTDKGIYVEKIIKE